MKFFPLILFLLVFSTCTVTKDFSKAYKLEEPLEFTDFDVNRNFEIDEVYLLDLKDGRELSFKVKDSSGSSLYGYITDPMNKNNNKSERLKLPFLEIPFESIARAKKVSFDRLLTFGIFGGIPIIIGIILLKSSTLFYL